MTIEETILSLYSDIAAIKEYICKENSTLSFYSETGVTMFSANYLVETVDGKAKAFVIRSQSDIYLSRVFDDQNQYGSSFDEFTYGGFGTYSFIYFLDSMEQYMTSAVPIDRSLLLVHVPTHATEIHIRPAVNCSYSIITLIEE
jgi:hypothetical protein